VLIETSFPDGRVRHRERNAPLYQSGATRPRPDAGAAVCAV